jgi:transcriptional repressor NrdR
VSSRLIGELVMDRLKVLDDVAYVRFASVYRRFQDISQFMTALNEILQREKSRRNKPKRRRR